MAHEAIGTAVMVIATVIITVALINAIFPSILSSSSSIRSSGGDADDRVGTSMAFINYETVSASELRFDVLNNGRSKIYETSFPTATVYLARETGPLMPISSSVSETKVYWDYTFTGADATWDQGETLVIQVHDPAGGFAEGNYRLRLQLGNGAMTEQAFTI